jgi:putative thioredoxin
MSSARQTPSAFVVNTTDETFHEDVLERSQTVPVVVDFWATWCAPCRALGPALEALAEECAGRFVLVKADVDRLPQSAMQCGVEAVPVVYGLIDGQVVDSFAGALPPAQLRQWVDCLLARAELSAAQRLEADQPADAEAKYRQIIQQQPNEAGALIGLARVLLALERPEEAREIIERLEHRGFLEPEAEKVKAALAFLDRAGGDVDSGRRAAETQPDNLQLQFELAEALAADQRHQEALDICLSLVERDRSGVGEAARKLMLDIFRLLPGESELVRDYRRKLSMLLY